MRAHALSALRVLLARIADQLDVLVRLLAIQAVESVSGQMQCLCKRTQQAQRHLSHRILPGEQRGAQRR